MLVPGSILPTRISKLCLRECEPINSSLILTVPNCRGLTGPVGLDLRSARFRPAHPRCRRRRARAAQDQFRCGGRGRRSSTPRDKIRSCTPETSACNSSKVNEKFQSPNLPSQVRKRKGPGLANTGAFLVRDNVLPARQVILLEVY